MSSSYICPNPECRAKLNTSKPIKAGKKIECPQCHEVFVPVPEEVVAAPAAGTFKFADDPVVKESGKKPSAAPPPKKVVVDDDDESAESIKKGYGVVKDTQAELDNAEKNKVRFGDVADKHKRSARGPAIALLVTPANLMTLAGLLSGVAGIVIFVICMWPLVFNDAPPGDEEVEDAIVGMLIGLMVFGMGAFICFGASQMQDLSSYMWGMAGAVVAIPLLVGIYAVIMLMDPKVKEGFKESEVISDDDESEKDKDEDKDDDEDEDEEDD